MNFTSPLLGWKKEDKSRTKKQITIGLADAATTAKDFIDVRKRAERGEMVRERHQLHFDNFELLLKTLTPGRWALLQNLHSEGPMSLRAPAAKLGRDHKNAHTDVRRLESTGLIERTDLNRI